jgi:hypothetical protein
MFIFAVQVPKPGKLALGQIVIMICWRAADGEVADNEDRFAGYGTIQFTPQRSNP